MANIYDVARLAKVSTATVSKVLSNTPYVSDKTRQKVLDAVVNLGYSPSIAARSLTGNRRFVIGLAIPYEPNYLFRDPFLLEVIQGIEEIANEHDYNLLFTTARKTNPQGAYSRLLNKGYVDGVVILETVKSVELDKKLVESGIPRVSVGYSMGNNGNLAIVTPSVHANDYLGALEATRHLINLGHRRIGLINGPANFMTAMEERYQGFCTAMAEAGLKTDPELMVNGDFTLESGIAAGQKLLQASPLPTAIFSFNDRMAVGAMRSVRERGLKIPHDLSIIGFDDVEVAQASDPPLTTIRQPAMEIGQEAARKLFAIFNGEKEILTETVLPAEFIMRGSTGPVST